MTNEPSVLASLYEARAETYFGTPRLDLLAMLPVGANLRVIELGAGNGATLREAKRSERASYTVGLDLETPSWPVDDPYRPDQFFSGDLERGEVVDLQGQFDVAICGDVLEHLVDPWRAVARLKDWLKPGGCVLASVPNVRNHRALRSIVLRGDFAYADSGLLDRGHLRFFCRRNVEAMFLDAGFSVEALEENMGAYGLRHRLLDRFTFGRLHEFFVLQYRIRARKPAA